MGTVIQRIREIFCEINISSIIYKRNPNAPRIQWVKSREKSKRRVEG